MAKKKDTYFMGKTTGYSLVDGVYHIAPMYTEGFEKLLDRRTGIDNLLKSITIHAAEINREIAAEQRRLWKMLSEDIGLDMSKNYSYFFDGTIREVEKVKAHQDGG